MWYYLNRCRLVTPTLAALLWACSAPPAYAAFTSDRVLNLTLNVTAGGQVSKLNLTHPANPNGPYTFEDLIQLTPTANSGYQFVEWRGPVVTSSGAGLPTHQLVMHNDLYVEAVFAKSASSTLTISGASNGSVVMNPPDNGGRARNGAAPDTYPRSQSVAQGSSVRLIAVPRGDYRFDRWTGPGVPAGQERANPLDLIMDASKQVTAQFVPHAILSEPLKQQAIKLHFQGHNVQSILHFSRDDSTELFTTTPTGAQTPDQAFEAVKNYLFSHVDFTQGLQINRYDPASQSYRRELVDPPLPIFNIDYFSTCNIAADSEIAQRIAADINSAGSTALRNQLENTFLHGRWTDPTTSANRLYFLKISEPSFLTNPCSLFKNYLGSAITAQLAANGTSSGVFMDDAWTQPPLPSCTQRYILNQPCFSASRVDIHAACTFTDGPNNTTIVTLLKAPGRILAHPTATLTGGATITATGYVSTADALGSDTTYTCRITFAPRIAQADFLLSYPIADPIVNDAVVRNRWPSDTLATLSYIRSQVPADKLVIYNTRNHATPAGDNYAFALSGTEDEYFIHSFYFDLDWRTNPCEWKRTVDDLAQISQNRVFLAQSGTSEDLSDDPAGTEPEVRRLAMFLFSSYLLGKGPYAYFNFDTPVNGQAGTNYLYFDFYDLDPQAPRNGYCTLGNDVPVQPADPYVPTIYLRRFDNALVLVNPALPGSAEAPFSISNAQSNFNVRVAEDGNFQSYTHNMLEGVLAPQSAVIFTRLPNGASIPTIAGQTGEEQTVIIGQSAQFFVAATGPGPLRYQWKHNGSDIPGATGATYTIPATSLDHNGDYTVTVANDAGVAVSMSTTLTVVIPPSIAAQPINQSIKQGGTAFFHVVPAGTPPFRFQWRKGNAILHNIPPFSEVTSDTLRITNVSDADPGVYNCVVANAGGYVLTADAQLSIDPSALGITRIVSRKIHGAGGAYDVDIPLWPTEYCTIEPRANPTLVLSFDRNLTIPEQNGISINSALTCGNGLTCSGNTVSMNLDQNGCHSYVLAGVNLDPRTLNIMLLEADVSNDGAVDVFDLVAVRNALSQPLRQDNFTKDLNMDGRIDVLDLVYAASLVRN